MPSAANAAEEFLRQGDLDKALASLQDAVRGDPADVKLRIFLFQLLCVLGDWDRALTQLNVCGDMDASTLMMKQTYQELIQVEPLREQIFEGKRQPVVFGEPLQWVAELIEALRVCAEGEPEKAAGIRERAFEAAEPTSGTIDGVEFQWIADADGRLGPVLEAVVNGRYCWVPFARIRRIRTEKPEDLRDLVWTPATFTWANGGETTGMIPTRYTGSASSADMDIRRARKTEFAESPDGLHGLGHRLLATDVDDYPLAEVRDIILDVEAPAAADGASADG